MFDLGLYMLIAQFADQLYQHSQNSILAFKVDSNFAYVQWWLFPGLCCQKKQQTHVTNRLAQQQDCPIIQATEKKRQKIPDWSQVITQTPDTHPKFQGQEFPAPTLYHPLEAYCKGLAACAMPAKCSAVLCCITLCAPHYACRYMGKVQQCLLGQQYFGIGCLDWY